ncbi:tyrosine-protein kinase family protein [Ilumatobacter coccineus]|uniref:AAA domain-containing protein n=1 Tax=Ilumatobacter coccineus (strain NBRC 103263 / KCTC 29153 / YM16-304) TaxID=1313172 RepID=A0A6C7E4D0_ILUCY|nr:putative protein-tyrosine kinase [Ilumatobacter coccineus]BAN01767.1 putative protein-tyrosine kinase [Ilumatobacter coccineus YM16-304]
MSATSKEMTDMDIQEHETKPPRRDEDRGSAVADLDLTESDKIGGIELAELDAIGDRIPDALAESVRYVVSRARLDEHSVVPARIGVVSSVSGDGTTTVALALTAMLDEQAPGQTCWVDLNWWSRSDAASVLDEAGPGLYEVLRGEAELDAVIRTSGGIATLRRGGVPDDERHRVARSGAMDRLIDELAGRYQHLVLDIPPLLGGSDSLEMLRHADAHLLVVRHGVTTVSQVRTAVDQIAGVESMGVILNQVKTRTPRPFRRWLSR